MAPAAAWRSAPRPRRNSTCPSRSTSKPQTTGPPIGPTPRLGRCRVGVEFLAQLGRIDIDDGAIRELQAPRRRLRLQLETPARVGAPDGCRHGPPRARNATPSTTERPAIGRTEKFSGKQHEVSFPGTIRSPPQGFRNSARAVPTGGSKRRTSTGVNSVDASELADPRHRWDSRRHASTAGRSAGKGSIR